MTEDQNLNDTNSDELLSDGYVIPARVRLRGAIPVLAYATTIGVICGTLPADARETLFPLLILPVAITGAGISHALANRTSGGAELIWSAQRTAMLLMIPAAAAFSLGGALQSKSWVGVATVFGVLAGAAFMFQFAMAVQYYRGANRGVLELLDLLTVICCALAIVGYVLIVPLFIAGVERQVPYALLPPVAIGFVVSILLLVLSSKRGKKTSELILMAAGGAAFVSGVLESVAALRGWSGDSTWVRSGLWATALALIAIAPLWGPTPEPAVSEDMRGSWEAPRLYLPYWSLLALPLLAILALSGHRSWGPIYTIVCTFIVFALVITRQLLTMRDNFMLFAEIAKRDIGRDVLLARTIQAAEEERKRLARDLHDGPVQDLSALMLRMGRAAERSTTAPEVLLADLRDRLGAQIQSIRETIAVLRPPLLDKAGLAKALEAEVANSFARETTEVDTQIDDIRGLTADQELQLFRIAQEAMRNARLHARATHVKLALTQASDDLVRLEIRDDGVGFLTDSPTTESSRGHMGLASMRERALLAGADLDLLSTPGAGTIVRTLVIPKAQVDREG